MEQPRIVKQNRGFQNWLVSYKMQIPDDKQYRDLLPFNNEIENALIKAIRQESNDLGPLKFSYTMLVKLRKYTNRGEENVESFLRQEFPIILNSFNRQYVKERFAAEINRKKEKIAGWVERGSGWVVNSILTVYLDFARNIPLRGGTYIPLSKKLKDKQAIINIQNRKNKCLRWALKAQRFPINCHSNRPSQYPTDAEDGLTLQAFHFQPLWRKYLRLKSLTTSKSMF